MARGESILQNHAAPLVARTALQSGRVLTRTSRESSDEELVPLPFSLVQTLVGCSGG